jgi:hypothetical protein
MIPGIEIIEITRHMGFNLGNAVKYAARAEFKEDKRQDLVKAIWYCLDEIYKDNTHRKKRIKKLKKKIEKLNK